MKKNANSLKEFISRNKIFSNQTEASLSKPTLLLKLMIIYDLINIF